MARPVVGIYASIAPASWGPWRDRPSAVAPAALGYAIQRAGWMAVLIAPDPGLERVELLGALDALLVFDDAAELDVLLGAARERGLAVRVLNSAGVMPDAEVEDFERQLAGLL
ncbi:MAG: hypothetical protein QOJ46_2733 [bacterium]|jgi:hypothetical protein